MKKLMLMVAMTMLVGLTAMAVDNVPYKDATPNLMRLITVEKDIAGADALMATVAIPTTENEKNWLAYFKMRLFLLKGKVSTIEEAKTAIANIATEVGVTNKEHIDGLITGMLFYAEQPQLSYDYFATLKNPSDSCIGTAISSLMLAKRYSDAVPLCVGIKDYSKASLATALMLDKAKTFEYSRKAILDTGFRTAPELVVLLDRVNGFDYADSSVTPKMLLDLAVATNKKYSNFLVKDKATWEPVITGLRTTIEEMKK